MFLAWKEMVKNKKRFALVFAIILLIAVLVFFLMSLSLGLADANRSAIDAWGARHIVLSKEANTSLYASSLTDDEAAQFPAGEPVIVARNVASKKAAPEARFGIVLFGAELSGRLVPPLVEGRLPQNEGEVVVSSSMAKEEGIALGDQLLLARPETTLKVTGFTEEAKLNVTPVVFLPLAQAKTLRLLRGAGAVSGIVLFDKAAPAAPEFEVATIKRLINELPGYRPQILTFSLMIAALIVVSALVLGIFSYIMTQQKKQLYAILRVQGIAQGYIGRSIIVQSLLISCAAVFGAVLLAVIARFALPASVPFLLNFGYLALIGVGLMVISLLGSLVSVLSVARTDPLIALR